MSPWNVPAPIDEMELKPKFQESDKHKKEKGNGKENEKRTRREERLEKAPSLRTVSSLP